MTSGGPTLATRTRAVVRGAGAGTPRRRSPPRAIAGLLTLAALALLQPPLERSSAQTPFALSDEAFWALTERISEPGGYFRSDNLVSNEDTLQVVIPRLQDFVRPGGVYLGVGPEQNFTLIAALRPRLAFIVDIRRGNLLEHLMYKALFEMAPDRATFVSLLFSRPVPERLPADLPADRLFAAFAPVRPSEALYDQTVLAIARRLTVRHGFALSDDDVAVIAQIFMNFYAAGPAIAYSNVGIGGRPRYPNYRDLQTATDAAGVSRAFLATNDAYRAVRTLQERNLIIPIVGDFAGPTALRAVGAWVRANGWTVTTFYLSNVEQYLFQSGSWDAFARNVAQLPLDDSSTFVRSCFSGCLSAAPFVPSLPRLGVPRAVMLLDSMLGLLADAASGRVRTYRDVLARSR